ncbi:NAD(P)/FAD-dependent oxidoreductase [Archaeoglobales archaeon]|nr:MAG: NAD(P)/FAD-dependent oxidoreductase [Archaeoglobales archaeon]
MDGASVLIVGGGPAGCLTAIELQNYDTTLIEEHQSVGFPVQCAGLISKDCFGEYLKYCKNVKKSLINRIRGAFFFSPNGRFVELEGRSKGVVIERKIFDRELMIEASKFAELKIKTKFDDGFNKSRYDFIIGADGVYSSVAKHFGFNLPEIYSAIQIECKFECLDNNMVELYFGNTYSDGFFAYAIPIDDFARIGVVSKSQTRLYLKNLLNKHSSVSKRVVNKKITELNVGAIPIGLINFVKNNVALVGDAAGMTKPYTGGGLFYLLKAVKVLGKTFPNLNAYQKNYLKEMKKEYEFGMKILKLYSILNDEDLNELMKIGSEFDLKKQTKKLHMDEPSTILKIIPMLPKILKNFQLAAKIARVMLL